MLIIWAVKASRPGFKAWFLTFVQVGYLIPPRSPHHFYIGYAKQLHAVCNRQAFIIFTTSIDYAHMVY